MTTRTTIGAGVLAGAVALAATGGVTLAATHGASAAKAGPTVTLKHIAFRPAKLTVRRGTTVTWLWRDGAVPHNVTFARSHSRTQAKGTYRLTFRTRGTFNYKCTIHPGMTGRITVR